MGTGFKHKIPDGVSDLRLLDYLLKHTRLFATRNSAKNAIKNGCLLLDGNLVETGRYVLSGQIITYSEAEKPLSRIFELPLEVIFEDDYLAVINKPAGFGVSGNYFRTIENALPFNLKPSGANDALSNPQAVHRLDNQTSGLLLVAKSHSARIDLGRQFEEKQISKRYHAIVIGEVPESGIIDNPIEDKEAITRFKRVQTVKSIKYGHLSLVALTPLTGRTHQLRIHLAGIGSPILGDSLYTRHHALFKHKGLYLCATGLEFSHPATGHKKTFSMELPNKFTALIKRVNEQYSRLNS